jgi:uroporphyrinogen decarboxylase
MPTIQELTSDEAKTDWLLEQMAANDGLAPVDLEKFWADDAMANADPFGKDIPQVPLGIGMRGEPIVFEDLGIEEDHRRYRFDTDWQLECNRKYNDLSERIVGRRLLNETPPNPEIKRPKVKQLHDIFGAENIWHGESWWLQQSADTPDELAALLDRVEARIADDATLREFLLPEDWDACCESLKAHGEQLPRYRGQRGPVTFACSIYGPENLIFLIMDQPALAERFRDTMLRAMLGMARVLDAEAGDTPETAPRGFSFYDDNCCLLNPEMYELFGWPVLKSIWDVYSPNPGDHRYQHSDSNMAHLLPLLSKLNLTGTNFGPTLTVREIRDYLPNAVINGQLAPFTFSRNDERGMVMEFLRDYHQALPERGLRFATAGSINNGSKLTGMRLIMSAIQHFGRYDAQS